MSNNYMHGVGAGEGNNAFGPRRDRDGHPSGTNGYTHNTGALPLVNAGRTYAGPFDFEEMINALRQLFVSDRQIASQSDNKRCGICYLYFVSNELSYREEEGFYVCISCSHALGKQHVPMLRRQQK